MTNEEIAKHIMSELIEKGDLSLIEKHFSADYVAHAGGKKYKGHKFLTRFTKQLRKAIPDIHAVDLQILTAEPDRIAWQRTLAGVHKVKMQGIPASKKKLTWVEMAVTRFEDGKIVEEWVVSDLMGQMLLNIPSK